LNAPTSTSSHFGAIHAVFWMSTALLWGVLGLLLLVAVREEAKSDLVSMGTLSAVAFLLTAALLTSRHPGGDSVSATLGLRPTSPWFIPLGFFGGALAQVPAEGIVHIESWYMKDVEQFVAEQAALLEPHGLLHSVLLVLVLAALVPFAEEAFFRGAVFGALRRSGRSGLQAGLITGIGFTLSHPRLELLAPILLVATYLTFLRAVSGSLWPSVAAHVGFNLVTTLAAVLRIPALQLDFWTPAWQGGALGAFLVIVLSSVLLARSELARASRMDEAIPVDG